MEWLKKLLSCVWFYVALFFLSLVIPFGINEIYKYGQSTDCAYTTLWGAKDVLGFFGEYLSFFGTIILGAVAVFQTEKANEKTDDANTIATEALKQAERSNQLAQEMLVQTERANELSAQMQKFEQAKFMSIISIRKLYINKRSITSPYYRTPEIDNPIIFDMADIDFWSFKDCYHIDVLFKNVSDYPILELYATAKGINGDANIRHGLKPAWSTVYISPRDEQAMRFIIPSCFFEKYKEDGLRISLEFVNVFDFHTLANIYIGALAKCASGSVKQSYKYQIQKLNDIKPLDAMEETEEACTID